MGKIVDKTISKNLSGKFDLIDNKIHRRVTQKQILMKRKTLDLIEIYLGKDIYLQKKYY